MKVKTTAIILALMAMLCACTHNDGDIGPLFGVWRVDSITADGVAEQLYDSETLLYTWRFQESVIYIQTILPYQDFLRTKGTWTRSGDVLTLKFGYSDADGTASYTPPAPFHFNADETPLKIEKLDKKHLVASWTADDGIKYVYTLSKAY